MSTLPSFTKTIGFAWLRENPPPNFTVHKTSDDTWFTLMHVSGKSWVCVFPTEDMQSVDYLRACGRHYDDDGNCDFTDICDHVDADLEEDGCIYFFKSSHEVDQ